MSRADLARLIFCRLLNLSYAYIAICQNDLITAKKYRLLLANMGAQASADDVTRYLEKFKLQ